MKKNPEKSGNASELIIATQSFFLFAFGMAGVLATSSVVAGFNALRDLNSAFAIAMRKRLALEELDKICSLNYLKNRMSINNNNTYGNLTKRRCSTALIEKKLATTTTTTVTATTNDEAFLIERHKTKPRRITCSLTKSDLEADQPNASPSASFETNNNSFNSNKTRTRTSRENIKKVSRNNKPKKSKSLLLATPSPLTKSHFEATNDHESTSCVQIKIEQQYAAANKEDVSGNVRLQLGSDFLNDSCEKNLFANGFTFPRTPQQEIPLFVQTKQQLQNEPIPRNHVSTDF